MSSILNSKKKLLLELLRAESKEAVMEALRTGRSIIYGREWPTGDEMADITKAGSAFHPAVRGYHGGEEQKFGNQ